MNNCIVTISGNFNDNPPDVNEIQAYIDRGRAARPGATLYSVTICGDGDDVELVYDYSDKPFERIRRITGYLVGSLDRFNDAKKAEVSERVSHGTEMDDVYIEES